MVDSAILDAREIEEERIGGKWKESRGERRQRREERGDSEGKRAERGRDEGRGR